MGLFDKLKQTVEDVPRAVPAASEQTTEVVFPKLPDTLEAFKTFPQAQLSTPSDTAALTVLALYFYPENAELYLQSGGADSPRAVQLRHAKDGKWYLWEQFLLADIRQPERADPWG